MSADSDTEEDNTTVVYYGIELRHWERKRLKSKEDDLQGILDRILTLGLRTKIRLYEHAEADPTDRDYQILVRTRQVLAAAAQTVMIMANISPWLLRAHGFCDPHSTSWLPELDNWQE